MTKIQAIRKFASIIAEQKVIIARSRWEANWSMDNTWSEVRLHIPTQLDYEKDESDIAFRLDFISRFPTALVFDDVTLAIVHEIGHWFTQDDYNWFDDIDARKQVKTDEDYLSLKSERLATDWAIRWLSDAKHRELAKQFEQEYFGE